MGRVARLGCIRAGLREMVWPSFGLGRTGAGGAKKRGPGWARGGGRGLIWMDVVVCVGDGRLAWAAPAGQLGPVQPRLSQPPACTSPSPCQLGPCVPQHKLAQPAPALE